MTKNGLNFDRFLTKFAPNIDTPPKVPEIVQKKFFKDTIQVRLNYKLFSMFFDTTKILLFHVEKCQL